MTALAQPVLTPFGRQSGALNTVVFHPAGGGLGQYVTLLSRLARRGPVHGVRAMGLVPGEEPGRTVDAMVERYLGLIRDLPDRPNLLVGWSLGGLLAWEAGTRLAAEGPAPAVVMIDSFAEPWSAYGKPREGLLADIRRGGLVPMGPAAAEAAGRTAEAPPSTPAPSTA
ncbi:alpha/beta fold hydrolase [Streptomyces sp. NPDC058284]|uniref:alpha/beta fold hydrolase n=1 Tax=unclassified Streptomyces TaxID=2593676 RepID=UPI003668FDCE